MKKLLIIPAILFFLLNSICFSQSGWVKISDSIPNFVITKILFTSSQIGYAGGGYYMSSTGAFLKTTNGGANWTTIQFNEHSINDFCFPNDNTGYMCSYSTIDTTSISQIKKTTNGGINWYLLKGNILGRYEKIKFFDVNTGIAAGSYGILYKTTNGGVNWFIQSGLSNYRPTSISCIDANNWLIATETNIMNKTTNGGVNWIICNFSVSGLHPQAFSFINSNTGFCTDYLGTVFKTTNIGSNWFLSDTVDHSHHFFCGYIFFVNPETGYISGYGFGTGTNKNIFKTTNSGLNWIPNFVLYQKKVESIYFLNSNTGFAGGWNGFIYRTTTGGSIFVNNISVEIPDKYSLSQNYPNPFNPSTNIRYQITNNKFVKITVIDLLGKEIETLVNEKQSPGTYEVTFDGSNYPSGVYFYKLSSGDFSETKKMILIK